MIAAVMLSIFDMVKAIAARKSMMIVAVVLRIFGMTNLDSLEVFIELVRCTGCFWLYHSWRELFELAAIPLRVPSVALFHRQL
jgi:hypothetical protein